jgi:hypothetical protein
MFQALRRNGKHQGGMSITAETAILDRYRKELYKSQVTNEQEHDPFLRTFNSPIPKQ